MRPEHALIGLHLCTLVAVLAIAVFAPRPGAPALLVSAQGDGFARALAWSENERAPLVRLDPASGEVIALIPNNYSLLRALGAGIVPIAADAAGCFDNSTEGTVPWKS